MIPLKKFRWFHNLKHHETENHPKVKIMNGEIS